jgi:hypothetical protein
MMCDGTENGWKNRQKISRGMNDDVIMMCKQFQALEILFASPQLSARIAAIHCCHRLLTCTTQDGCG